MTRTDMNELSPEKSLLGKKATYDRTYNPDHLFPIPRAGKRQEIGIETNALPFFGIDRWNHYEVSWLNERGKPVIAIGHLTFNCNSPYLIESKSLKLYFNSLNDSRFKDSDAVATLIKNDLQTRVLSEVSVNLFPHQDFQGILSYADLQGECIDNLDIECSRYQADPSLLATEGFEVKETLCSHLLKSNCLVTGQPDWGSLQVEYQGNKINHESLLKYIVSFRHHNGFGEHCVEKIFLDILKHCEPKILMVTGQYTRRGGIDINVVRSTHGMSPHQTINRHFRQ